MEGPSLGPGGEDITWPDQVAPGGRKASDTRKIKPQTSNLIAPGAFCLVVPPLDQEYPALGRAGLGPRGSCSGLAGPEGTQVSEGRQQGGDVGELRALPPKEAGGPPEWPRPAIPPPEGVVLRGARHCQAGERTARLAAAVWGSHPCPYSRGSIP